MNAPAFDPRITPARPDLAAAHLEGRVPAARYVAGQRRGVRAPSVPLRRHPDPQQGIDTELLYGEVFVVYEADAEGWSWGQAELDGYVGWLPSEALGPEDAEAPRLKVNVLRTFVYPGPTIKLPVQAALSFGARLRPLATEGAFVRIAEGFVWAGHLGASDQAAADPVAIAEMFIGVPYLWGGKSSLGLDCSGLVQTALRACNHPAPRDSDMQEASLGTAIDPDGTLLRGDLVFWRGHVGLMRDAVTLLHASGATMTVVSESLAAARRRIGEGGGQVTRAARLRSGRP